MLLSCSKLSSLHRKIHVENTRGQQLLLTYFEKSRPRTTTTDSSGRSCVYRGPFKPFVHLALDFLHVILIPHILSCYCFVICFVPATAAVPSFVFLFFSRCPFCKKAKQLMEDLLDDPADYEVSSNAFNALYSHRARLPIHVQRSRANNTTHTHTCTFRHFFVLCDPHSSSSLKTLIMCFLFFFRAVDEHAAECGFAF